MRDGRRPSYPVARGADPQYGEPWNEWAPDETDSGSSRDAGSSRANLWHTWQVLTGPGDDAPVATLEQRERLRRARLTSAVIFGLLLLALGVLPLGLQDRPTLGAVGAVLVTCLVAAGLNRGGHAVGAGAVLVAVALIAVAGGTLGAGARGGLDWVYLPDFDLFVIVIGVAGVVLTRPLLWAAATICMAFIASDLALQPKSHALQAFVDQYGVYVLMARPIFVILAVTILLHLLSWSVEQAIRRADRAEEVAAIEHELAEQKRQLEVGIRQILDTHVRVANGDLNARAPLNQDNVLYQIASALNNLLNRMARSVQAEHYYQRTLAEIGRLRDSLLAIRAGRAPLWPAPSGTPVDGLIEVLAGPGRPGPASNFPAMSPQAFPGAPSGGVPGLPGAPSGGSGRFPGAPGGTGPVSTGGTSSDFTGFPPRVPGSGPTPRGPNSGPGARRGPVSRPRPGGPAGGGAPRDWGTPPAAPPAAPSTNPWDMPQLPDWPPPEEPEAQG